MTKLELDEEKRRYKWGKYGIRKYIYQKEEEDDIKIPSIYLYGETLS